MFSSKAGADCRLLYHTLTKLSIRTNVDSKTQHRQIYHLNPIQKTIKGKRRKKDRAHCEQTDQALIVIVQTTLTPNGEWTQTVFSAYDSQSRLASKADEKVLVLYVHGSY